MAEDKNKLTRRGFIARGALGAGLLAVGGGLGGLLASGRSRTVWQIDPDKCVQCEKCAANCVLDVSAVKCVHAYAICGYCDLCTGFFQPDAGKFVPGAANELCPTGAIKRSFIEDPYYEYTIDESLCIGCGKCVKGCAAFGNGSLFLQVRHDRCLNCNECGIAAACPSQAFVRLPADRPYLLKTRGTTESG